MNDSVNYQVKAALAKASRLHVCMKNRGQIYFPISRVCAGGAERDPGGAELSLRGVRDAATSAEIASAAPRNDNQGGSATGPAQKDLTFPAGQVSMRAAVC